MKEVDSGKEMNKKVYSIRKEEFEKAEDSLFACIIAKVNGVTTFRGR